MPARRSHAKIHPIISNYLEKFGYYDIFLVDAVHGNVQYSVFKELDYGTSLKSGPWPSRIWPAPITWQWSKTVPTPSP